MLHSSQTGERESQEKAAGIYNDHTKLMAFSGTSQCLRDGIK